MKRSCLDLLRDRYQKSGLSLTNKSKSWVYNSFGENACFILSRKKKISLPSRVFVKQLGKKFLISNDFLINSNFKKLVYTYLR